MIKTAQELTSQGISERLSGFIFILLNQNYEIAFNPVTPTIIIAKLMIRKIFFDSPNATIFNMTAPAVPIPIRTV